MGPVPVKSLERPAAWDWRLAVPVVLLIAAFDVAVGYAATGSPWVVVGLVVALFAIVLLLSSGTALFLTVFVAKPFIDMLWFASTNVGGVRVDAQSIVSIAVLGVGLLIIMIRRIELPSAVFIPMALFAASNVIALLMTPSLANGADNFIRIVCGFPLAFVVPTLVTDLPAPRRLLQYFMVVIGVVYVTILLQPLGVIPYSSSDSGIQRATGFYYHPWDVARYLVVALPLILAIMEDRTSSPLLRWTYRALFAATLLVTFFTYLKAAWIAILVADRPVVLPHAAAVPRRSRPCRRRCVRGLSGPRLRVHGLRRPSQASQSGEQRPGPQRPCLNLGDLLGQPATSQFFPRHLWAGLRFGGPRAES